MRKILLLIVTSLSLLAAGIDDLPELTNRGGIIYKKFSDQPFTGKGKVIIRKKERCHIYVADVNNGQPDGLIELWTCGGNLIEKKTMVNGKIVGRVQMWDEKTWKKTVDKTYDKNGNVKSGWEKHSAGGLMLMDLTWENGKKTGYSTLSGGESCPYGKLHYFVDDVDKGCRDIPK